MPDGKAGSFFEVLSATFILTLAIATSCFATADDALSYTPVEGEPVVKPGDWVEMRYLCRLKTGEVAASSDPVAETEKKSAIFKAEEQVAPAFILMAVSPDEPLPEQLWPGPFESEIQMLLARGLTGMKVGEKRRIELSAKMIPGINEQEGFAWLAKTRTRPKEMKMPRGDYEFRAQKTPEVGQTYFYDPAFPGKVERVTETDVIIRFTATPGDTIETPFGQGRIREEGDNYKVDIDAKEGTLVRTGNKIGRITKVDDKVITIDYRHPFGYEELGCDVTVVKIVEKELLEIGAED